MHPRRLCASLAQQCLTSGSQFVGGGADVADAATKAAVMTHMAIVVGMVFSTTRDFSTLVLFSGFELEQGDR
jgi:hypothetical protein